MGEAYSLHGTSDKTHALADNPSSRLVFKFVALLALQARSQNCDKRLLTLGVLMSYIYIYIYDISSLKVNDLTLILITWRKW
jgi:hypothetical protein